MWHVIDVKWIAILPLGFIAAFWAWVFLNLAKDVVAQKRKWIRKYNGSEVYTASVERDGPIT